MFISDVSGIDASVPLHVCPLAVQLIRMDVPSLVSFRNWIINLPHSHVVLLVNLLCVETKVLLDIKTRLSPNIATAPRAGEKRTRDGTAKGDPSPDLLADQLDEMLFTSRKSMRTDLTNASPQAPEPTEEKKASKETIIFSDNFLGEFEFDVGDFPFDMSLGDSGNQDFGLWPETASFGTYESSTTPQYSPKFDGPTTSLENDNNSLINSPQSVPIDIASTNSDNPNLIPYPTYPPPPTLIATTPTFVPASPLPAPFALPPAICSSTVPSSSMPPIEKYDFLNQANHEAATPSRSKRSPHHKLSIKEY